MHDDNLPPDDSTPAPPSPMGDGPDMEQKSLCLQPDQMASLGLDAVDPGKTYTLQLKAGNFDPDTGQDFEVLSAAPDMAEGGDMDSPAGSDEAPTPPPIMDEAPGALPDEAESSPLGFDRKKKPAREGLPDTKKMRNL